MKANTTQIDIKKFEETFWFVLKKLEPDFVINQYNKTKIDDLILYFYGSPNSPYDISKGIALYGNVGSGKTVVMTSFMKTCSHYKINPFAIYHCDEMAMEFKYNNGFERIGQYCKYAALFDDVIGEKKQRIYGNFEDAFEYIFTCRERKKLITHLTMNDRPEEFKKFYDPRLRSRMNSLWTFVKFKSDIDYRTLKSKNDKE